MDLNKAAETFKAVLQHSEMITLTFREWRELVPKEEWEAIEDCSTGGQQGVLSALVQNLGMLESLLMQINHD